MDLLSEPLYAEIKKSFPKLERLLTPEKLADFSHTPKFLLYQYQCGLGTQIRVALLRPKHRLYKSFLSYGILYRNYMSAVLIEQLYEQLKSRR